MRREDEDPSDEAPRTADLAEADRAESADGLPLPAPDDAATRLARDAGEPEKAPGEEDAQQRELAGEISAERGAD
jgi:hypothetical protein